MAIETESNGKKLLTTGELERRYGISRQKLWRLLKKGTIPGQLKIGNRWLFIWEKISKDWGKGSEK